MVCNPPGRGLAAAAGVPGVEALLHDRKPNLIGSLSGRLGREIAFGIAARVLGLRHDQLDFCAVALKGKRLCAQALLEWLTRLIRTV